MTIPAELLSNPGSFKEFESDSGLEGDEAIEAYSLRLQEYRRQLAIRAGINLEDLHDRKKALTTEIDN